MPTFGDETLHDRYAREHADHMARLARMTPEQIAELELSLHNALAEVDRLRAQAQAAPEAEPVALSVWYGPMPESNGKSNYTAILHRKGECMSEGITIDRGEYPDRVRYEADCMRFLIGDLSDEPDILDYDAEAHSGYITPQYDAELVERERERENAECFRQIATDLIMKVLILTAPGDELRRSSADALERIDAKLATLSAKP